MADKKKIVHPEFARRMQIACDGNPNIPLPNHGRLGWFSFEIERRFNAKVTIETVRKWFAGETIPRTKMMGYHSRATIHGFRSTASTILNESGLWSPDAIERQLAHVPGNVVRSAYNAAQYLPERRRMMEWWSDYLDKMKG